MRLKRSDVDISRFGDSIFLWYAAIWRCVLYGVESWSGAMELSIGVEWSQLL